MNSSKETVFYFDEMKRKLEMSHSLTHSLTHSLIHSFIHSLTHYHCDCHSYSRSFFSLSIQRTWCRYSCSVDKPSKVVIYDTYKQQIEKENQQQQQSQQQNTKKIKSTSNREEEEEEERLKRIPPLNICSIKVQTLLNQETRQNEIIAISFLMKYNGSFLI
jgi:hypothetical protein